MATLVAIGDQNLQKKIRSLFGSLAVDTFVGALRLFNREVLHTYDDARPGLKKAARLTKTNKELPLYE